MMRGWSKKVRKAAHVPTGARGMLLLFLLSFVLFIQAVPGCGLCINAQPVFAAQTESGMKEGCSAQLSISGQEGKKMTIALSAAQVGDTFDFGIAYHPKEARLVEYGFLDAFREGYAAQRGTLISHSFVDGTRVSDEACYIVFGGVAKKGASISGNVAFVTLELIAPKSEVAVVEGSASFSNAEQIFEAGSRLTLLKAQASAAPEGGQTQSVPEKGGQSTTDTPDGQPQFLPNEDKKPQPSTGAQGESSQTPSAQTGGQSQPPAESGGGKPKDSQKTENAPSKNPSAEGTQSQKTKTGDETGLLLPICGILFGLGAFLLLNNRRHNGIM